MEKIRTRFAPSPTGYMHIGNLRTAIFEYLIARKLGGEFVLRIEDTDQARKVDGAIDFIYDTLKLCNLEIDEGPNNEGAYGPYVQSERKEIYKEYALKLVELGKAYFCFCDEERLTNLRELANKEKKPFMYDGHCKKLTKEEIEEKLKNNETYVIRQSMPKTGVTTVEDLVYGTITIDNSVLEDQILLKSDGFPTYNFANVVDDHLMKITHIIRGHEYLDQSAKYNLLYEAFGWEKPTYIHVAMVLGEDGNKLSKRNGDASFMDLYNEGYLPHAIVNYLALLGWSPETNQEMFTMEELINNFNPKRINKSDSMYDQKKLKWFNANYIRKMEDEEYLNFIRPYLENSYDLSSKTEEWINHLLLIYKDHIEYGSQIKDVVTLFFEDKKELDEECKTFMEDDSISNTLNVFKEEIESINSWSVDAINNAITNVKEKANVKGKMLYMPIRIQTTGQMHGPELPDTLFLLGKENVLKYLKD